MDLFLRAVRFENGWLVESTSPVRLAALRKDGRAALRALKTIYRRWLARRIG